MQIRLVEIRNFRGFKQASIKPAGHIVLMGEPRAGRSDVVEGLVRTLSTDATRFPLTDDLDFYGRDRTTRPEVEVTLGDLGPELTQLFFDHLEFWDASGENLIETLDEAEELDKDSFEPVVRLCYRAEWSDTEEIANHWVDYPKNSDPDTGDYARVRRSEREALPFYSSSQVGSRPLSLVARAVLRQIVESTPGDDFPTHLEALVDDIRVAAEKLGESVQVRDSLESILAPARLPLDTPSTGVGDLLRFAPEGGVLGSVLRSLSATLDLSDGGGFLPLPRHGSTLTALFAVCELVAAGGSGVVLIDDLGEGLDSGTARHLAATLRKQARQVWLTTRHASVAQAFRPSELVRLAFDIQGERAVYIGREPADRSERLASRHFALQLLPAMTARGLILLEGPHDRAAYGALAERLLRDDGVPLPAARRIAIADAGAVDASGGSSALPRLADAARKLGLFTVVVIDGDKDETAIQAAVDASDAVIRLPRSKAVERAILDGLDESVVRDAVSELDVPVPPRFAEATGGALLEIATDLLKKQGGLHAQFLDALPRGTQPALARRVLEAAIEAVGERKQGLIQL
jgi:putative ATP-dependent endonuclease of OLD family